ncbi:MAG: alpha-mannosidase [Clostridia bacterium]|nr:alpha-mannosidase [Clostridia bacterium]
MKNLHLVCNAHIDVVWLWEIEEGVAEALSTFRVAADFCDDYDGFVFCHNEAILYQWVEEYDPTLFKRIQKLVAEKKWHIMGGWYLQPDANMPSGESFVRQILEGRYYFLEKFGVEPTTAINFDAFGHTRGLVQILKKSGYDSYVFCRPEPDMLVLPAEDFNWVGKDGSKIACHRAYNSYESHRGEADEKIKGWMEKYPDQKVGIVLWGIGNHGGGPSRVDYEKIKELNLTNEKYNLIHSTPENYFSELLADGNDLPDYDGLLNPRYTGCYTTQSRTKMLHRKLENELFMTEKMAAHAAMASVMGYPAEKIREATKDLMLVEFHDILPGSAIQPVEQYSQFVAGHALKELKDLKIHAFLSLCSDKEKAAEGTIPVFVYNPHPFELEQTVEVEFQLPDQNKNRALYAVAEVFDGEEKIPVQREHEASNFNVDWRIRLAFRAKLDAGAMKRFDVKMNLIPNPAESAQPDDKFVFDNGKMKVEINFKTGLVDSYEVAGKEFFTEGALKPLVIEDDENSWAHKEREFRNVKGAFELMTPKRAAEFCAIKEADTLTPVHIIEQGEVRTIIEALFEYGNSQIVRRYYLDNFSSSLKITEKVYWNEKTTMLKLSVPTTIDGEYIGQTAYSSEDLLTNGEEMVSQKWNIAADRRYALSVINNGTYGSDYLDGEIRPTLLRSPGYSAGKSDFSVRKPHIMEQDRFSPMIDQGEHDFEFVFCGGDREERFEKIEREAVVMAEAPAAMSFFPIGCEKDKVNSIKPFAELTDDVVTLSVFKKAERGEGYVIRLFNPSDEKRTTTLKLPAADFVGEFTLGAYEIKTVRFDPETGEVKETDLTER